MLTELFDYELPEDRIAQQALPRGRSRLLRLQLEGSCSDHSVSDLPALLQPGDLVVLNDTRVIPARLFARRLETGGRIEILLLERQTAADWTAFLRPGRRVRAGSVYHLGEGLDVEVLGKQSGDKFSLRFSDPIETHLDRLGHVPLPPYIRRPDNQADRDRYQTVYARVPGAVAAPTAGLHFTEAMLDELRAAGIGVTTLTLHVGPGTFRPVAAKRIEDHLMDAERFELPSVAAQAIAATRSRGGRVVAVGTTVVRALESVARTHEGRIVATAGETDLFITPGFQFQVVDLLLTNFHLPRSTLLMLVCAFSGRETVLSAYRHAIDRGYRFYSYGDAMLAGRSS